MGLTSEKPLPKTGVSLTIATHSLKFDMFNL